MSLSARFMTVTPDQAKIWLSENNIDNRKVRLWWVDSLAEAIKREEFRTTHQGVAFTKSGRMVDGQHRLMAIVLANKPVNMLVVDGLDNDVFKAIDCGMKRNTSELTDLPKKVAECCRYICSLIYRNPTPDQIISISNIGVMDIHAELTSICATNTIYYSSCQMRVAAIIQVMNGHDRNYIYETYKNLVLQDFNNLPGIALALIRQVNQKKATLANKGDALTRDLKVFDPKNKDNSKIQVNDGASLDSIHYVKDTIFKYISQE